MVLLRPTVSLVHHPQLPSSTDSGVPFPRQHNLLDPLTTRRPLPNDLCPEASIPRNVIPVAVGKDGLPTDPDYNEHNYSNNARMGKHRMDLVCRILPAHALVS